MPLPATIRVKISSEAAGYVALTPVVVQEIPFADLLEYISAAAGSDTAAVASMLERGVAVSGASRFRWEGFAAPHDDLAALLAKLPKDDPSRAFDATQCQRMTFVSQARRFNLPRALATRNRLFRTSFWDAFLRPLPAPAYVCYLHGERADVYRLTLDREVAAALRQSAPLLTDRGAARLLASHAFTAVEFIVPR
ncbi:MAG: hypothetical protein C0504_08510 [Candidatus Solibacter sp.]|nr:hypothetical protein [Candidatus Solibacter sp.]